MLAVILHSEPAAVEAAVGVAEDRGQDAVVQEEPVRVQQRRDVPHGAGELHIAGAGPTARVEQPRHQEAGRKVTAVAGEVRAEDLLRRAVRPNEIGRGVIVPEAGKRRRVKINAHLLIDRAAVAHPRLVVAEEHEHHRGITRVQLLRQTDIFADRFIHAEEVVVENITALLRPAACFGRNIGNGALRFGVGAVILIAHREGEQGRAVRRVEVGEQVVRELLVGMPHGDVGVDQLAKAVFRENAPVKAEVVVHALAVIEPAVAGVRVVRRIALRREVADVGAGRAAVFVVLARAGEDETYKLIEQFREEVPGIHLRTTLMVGHPGETEADFEELKEFVRKVRFDRMGAFAYSEEEGTYAAAEYEDSIPQEVKQARLDELMSIQQGISGELSAEKVGRQMKVIIDRLEGEYYIGRTEFDSPEVDPEVLIERGDRALHIGNFYHVEIVNSDDFDLFGRII